MKCYYQKGVAEKEEKGEGLEMKKVPGMWVTLVVKSREE